MKHNIAVIGMGYVGFPLACLLANHGYEVAGIDINSNKVDRINRGELPFEYPEAGLKQLFQTAKLKASLDYKAIGSSQAVIIAVETPVGDSDHQPEYLALKSAMKSVGQRLTAGTLVIIESTIAPGTTRNIVVPILEQWSNLSAKTDFLVAHCPERVSPTEMLYKLQNMPRLIGGYTPSAASAAAKIYRTFVRADIDLIDDLSAELAKTAENAYRDVQIAFANELESICSQLGIDFQQARALINKVPERNVHRAGNGVGGHCIPKDSWLLLMYAKPRKYSVIEAARRLNDSRPKEVFNRLLDLLASKRISLSRAKVALLGVAYLPQTDDIRNSPTMDLMKYLSQARITYQAHDQFVVDYHQDLDQLIKWANAVVIMIGHQQYKLMNKSKLAGKVVLDIGRTLI